MSGYFNALTPPSSPPLVLPQPRPYRCPICAGCGTVAGNFYNQIGYSTSATREQCRACGGRGIVIA